ncbi:MAG: cytochrome c3 family protein [Syntrophales bacterium]
MSLKEYRKNVMWIILAGCCLLMLVLAVGAVSAAPKQVPGAKAGDCAACHGADKVLPDSHPGVKDMKWKDCQACHTEGKMSLVGKMPGSHRHQFSGVNCAACHGTGQPEPLAMDKCVSCHGPTAKLAEKTAKVKPENPHTSPHYGTELDCTLCHKQHAKNENYCNQCHKFDFKVP